MRKRIAFTLIEVLVVFFILGIISVPIYYMLSDARYKSSMISAKDYAKNEANKILKIVENDLTQARKGTFKQSSDNVIKINVRKVSGNSNKDIPLKYTYIDPHLYRTVDNREWIVSKNVSEFFVSESNEAGRMILSLKTKATFDGMKEEDAQVYSQEKLIVMREDSSEELDKHWRDVGDQDSFIQKQGSIMGGLKDDAGKIIQDFADVWSGTAEDIAKMPAEEAKKIVDNLMGALDNVKDSIKGIDDDVKGLGADAFFKRNIFGGMSKKKKRAAERVKNTLISMDTKESMDWDKVKDAGDISFSSLDTDAIRGFFDAKAKVFESGQDIVKQLDDFKEQNSSSGVNLSGINRNTWGL